MGSSKFKEIIERIGIENAIIYCLLFVIIVVALVYLRINYLTGVLNNMCFFDYPKDYVCSCKSFLDSYLPEINLTFP